MKKLFVLFVSLVMIVSLSGCNLVKQKIKDAVQSAMADATQAPAESAEPDTAEPEATETDATEKPDEPEATVNPDDMDVKDGNTDLWKDDIPAYVPRFGYGEYLPGESGKLEYNGSAVISLLYKGVKAEELKEYSESMKEAGYADVSYAEYDGGAVVTGSYKKDGVESAILMSLDTAADKCTLVITVTAK